MDPLLLAQRLPEFAERAMRDAIVEVIRHGSNQGRRTRANGLCSSALLNFQQLVARYGPSLPASVFDRRQAIARGMRAFAESRLARRLQTLPSVDVLGARRGAPFDVIVRASNRQRYAVVFCCLPSDDRRLERLRSLRAAVRSYPGGPLAGVVVYDFTSARSRTLRCRSRAETLAA